MNQGLAGRCAACKYLRRKCPSDCIFSLYFPPDDPQKFACIHKIYGAGNVAKMLQQLPESLRGAAAESLYQEARWRLEDPVYGCVGMISSLQYQIHQIETELAMIRAQLALLPDTKYQDSHHGSGPDSQLGPN